MTGSFKTKADDVLRRIVDSTPGVPGVIAGVTDAHQTLYLNAQGVRRAGGTDPVTTDSPVALLSTTKAITATAALRLVEQGRLDLDAPASRYAPDLGRLQVLAGFEQGGEPTLRPPTSQITTRQLLTHSSGLGYEYFNADYARLVNEERQPPIATSTRAALNSPLLFDPGTRWEYGSGIDWVGQVIEGITGQGLGAVLSREVLEPLGITTMSFAPGPEQRRALVGTHLRTADGGLVPLDVEPSAAPEVESGGHGLYGTVGDYLKFIRMWLNDGAGEHGRVLRAETVRDAVLPHLPDHVEVTAFRSAMPTATNAGEFYPGVRKSWSLAFMVNQEETPTGRPAGSQGWAGLANLYYWIDRENGIGGFWATQVLPFIDPLSYGGYLEFEQAAYEELVRAPDPR